MKKNKALHLLATQKAKIRESESRKEWLVTTAAILVQIFPLSANYKIEQLTSIINSPDYKEGLSSSQKDSRIWNKEQRFLEDCEEEVRLLGIESRSDNAFLFARNINFWIIIIAVASISYVLGNINTSDQTGVQKKYVEELTRLRNQLEIHQKRIDSLTKVINEKNRVI